MTDSSPPIPPGALRVNLPSRKSRVLARVELGSDPREATRLQHMFTLRSAGTPHISAPVPLATFTNEALPKAEASIARRGPGSEADINPGMAPLQAKVRAVEALVKSGPDDRARVDGVIQSQALPHLQQSLARLGAVRNGWARPTPWSLRRRLAVADHDQPDRDMGERHAEVVYFKTNADGGGAKLDGGTPTP